MDHTLIILLSFYSAIVEFFLSFQVLSKSHLRNSRLIVRSIDSPIDWLIYLFSNRSIDWLIVCLIVRLIDWLCAWLIDWLIDCVLDWSIDWLIVCLIDRLIDWLSQGFDVWTWGGCWCIDSLLFSLLFGKLFGKLFDTKRSKNPLEPSHFFVSRFRCLSGL